MHGSGNTGHRPKKRIVADELNRALRNEERWAEVNHCPREAQFHELYEAIGNKEKQDRIREEAERRPCYILLQNPNACDCLPEDIGTVKAGQPCPNNPYDREAQLLSDLRGANAILEIAHYLDELCRLHRIDPDHTDPESWVAMRIMMQRAKAQQLQAMQSAIMRVIHLQPGQKEKSG